MKKQHIQLSESERTQLEQLLKQGSLPARKFKRVLGILELNRGRTFTAVSQTVGATSPLGPANIENQGWPDWKTNPYPAGRSQLVVQNAPRLRP